MTKDRAFALMGILFVYSLFLSISLQTLLLSTFLILFLICIKDEKKVCYNKICASLFIFWLISMFCSFFSPYKGISIKKSISTVLFDSALPFILGMVSAKYAANDIKKHANYAFFIFTSLALILYLLSPHSFSPVFNRKGILNGFLGGKLTYAGVLSTFSASFVEKLSYNATSGIIGLFLLVISLAANTSRSYILGLFISLTGLLIYKFKKYYRIFIPTIVILLLGLFAFPRARARLRTTSLNNPDRSIEIRISLWKMGLKIVSDHPFTGIGFETWPHLAVKLIHEYGDSLLQTTLKNGTENSRAIRGHFHNTYIQMAVNGGVILLVFYLYLIFTILKESFYLEEPMKSAFLFMFLIFLIAGFFEYNLSDAEVAHAVFFFSGLYLQSGKR